MNFLGAKVLLVLAVLVDFASSNEVREPTHSSSQQKMDDILRAEDEDELPTPRNGDQGDQVSGNDKVGYNKDGDDANTEAADEPHEKNAASGDSDDGDDQSVIANSNNGKSSTDETRATSNQEHSTDVESGNKSTGKAQKELNNKTIHQDGAIKYPPIDALGHLTKEKCPKLNSFVGLPEGNISHCKKTANNVMVAYLSQTGEDHKIIIICPVQEFIFHHGKVFVYNQKGNFNSLIRIQSLNETIRCPKDNSLVPNIAIMDPKQFVGFSKNPEQTYYQKMLKASAEYIQPAVIAILLLICMVLGAIIARGGSKKYSGPNAQVQNVRNEPATKVTL